MSRLARGNLQGRNTPSMQVLSLQQKLPCAQRCRPPYDPSTSNSSPMRRCVLSLLLCLDLGNGGLVELLPLHVPSTRSLNMCAVNYCRNETSTYKRTTYLTLKLLLLAQIAHILLGTCLCKINYWKLSRGKCRFRIIVGANVLNTCG